MHRISSNKIWETDAKLQKAKSAKSNGRAKHGGLNISTFLLRCVSAMTWRGTVWLEEFMVHRNSLEMYENMTFKSIKKFYCFKSYCYGWTRRTFLSCMEIYCCLFCGVWRVNDWRSTLLVSSLQNLKKKIPLKYPLNIKRMKTFFKLFLNKCSWYVSKKFHIWCLFTSEGSKEVVQIEGEEGAGKINMVFDRQQAGVR